MSDTFIGSVFSQEMDSSLSTKVLKTEPDPFQFSSGESQCCRDSCSDAVQRPCTNELPDNFIGSIHSKEKDSSLSTKDVKFKPELSLFSSGESQCGRDLCSDAVQRPCTNELPDNFIGSIHSKEKDSSLSTKDVKFKPELSLFSSGESQCGRDLCSDAVQRPCTNELPDNFIGSIHSKEKDSSLSTKDVKFKPELSLFSSGESQCCRDSCSDAVQRPCTNELPDNFIGSIHSKEKDSSLSTKDVNFKPELSLFSSGESQCGRDLCSDAVQRPCTNELPDNFIGSIHSKEKDSSLSTKDVKFKRELSLFSSGESQCCRDSCSDAVQRPCTNELPDNFIGSIHSKEKDSSLSTKDVNLCR